MQKINMLLSLLLFVTGILAFDIQAAANETKRRHCDEEETYERVVKQKIESEEEKSEDKEKLSRERKIEIEVASILLYDAVRIDNIKLVKEALSKGADVNYFDKYGFAVLTKAALESSLDIIKLLLENGANVNIVDSEGETALMWAVCRDDIDIVRLLLEKGANVNADTFGKTALMRANDKKIVELLLENGADVNAVDKHGNTALMWAVSRDNIDAVRLLLEKGADVNAINEYVSTALMSAVFKDNIDNTRIILMLINAGANVNVKDKYGYTPLIEAVYNNKKPEIVELLLDNGADVFIKNNAGKTVYDFATDKPNLEKLLNNYYQKKANKELNETRFFAKEISALITEYLALEKNEASKKSEKE